MKKIFIHYAGEDKVGLLAPPSETPGSSTQEMCDVDHYHLLSGCSC